MADTSGSAKTTPPPPKKGRTLVAALTIFMLVLVAGGGVGAFFILRHRAPADVESAESSGSAEPAKPVAPALGMLALEPFVVNLADAGGTHFLRVSIRLLVDDRERTEHIQKNEVVLTRLRSAILELLTQQTAERLITPEGKEALKKAVATRAAPVLGDAKVSDVLFSDFVVQF